MPMIGTAEVWINEDNPPKLVVSAPYYPEFIIDLRNRKIERMWDREAKVYKFALFYTKAVVDCLHHHFREVIKTPSVGMYYLFSFLDTSDIEDVYRVLAKKHRDGDMRRLLDSLFGRFWQLEETMDVSNFRQFRFWDSEAEEMDAYGTSPMMESADEIRQTMAREIRQTMARARTTGRPEVAATQQRRPFVGGLPISTREIARAPRHNLEMEDRDLTQRGLEEEIREAEEAIRRSEPEPRRGGSMGIRSSTSRAARPDDAVEREPEPTDQVIEHYNVSRNRRNRGEGAGERRPRRPARLIYREESEPV